MIYLWSDTALLLLKDRVTAMHSHYALEIYLGLDGPFQMDFGEGNRPYRCLLLNSKVPHRFTSGRGPCALVLVNPADLRSGAMLQTLLKGERLRDLSNCLSQGTPDAVSTAFDEGLSCREARCRVDDLIRSLHRTVTGSDAVDTGKIDARIREACGFIYRSYQDAIELRDLAARAHLSESRFRHLFKQETGLSIRQFILNTRAVAAVKLILQGDSITSAAHGVGFSDTAHLSRTFKGMYGLSLSSLYKGRPDRRCASAIRELFRLRDKTAVTFKQLQTPVIRYRTRYGETDSSRRHPCYRSKRF